MKAIVTVLDDDGRIIEKDKVIFPCDEHLNGSEDYVVTKTTVFRFGIVECIGGMIVGEKKQEEEVEE